MQLGISQAKLSEADANVAQAQAAVDRSEEQLANATIRAPINATVLTRDVEIGSPVSSILNMGSAATLVMTLGDINQVFVRGKVDEVDIGRVRLGQTARITVETFKDKKFDGRVTQISPIGAEKDNVTTFEVKVSIDNPGNELKANMTANAEIVLEEFPNSLIIPESAISYDAQRNPTVDLADPGAKGGKRKVTIKTGVGNGTKTQVVRRAEAGRQGRVAELGSAVATVCRICGSAVQDARSTLADVPEPLGAQAPKLPDDVRDPVGRDLGRHPVGDRGGLPPGQRARPEGAGQEHRDRLGRPHEHCRPAASAQAVASR